jgi:serine/threonine protein kinase
MMSNYEESSAWISSSESETSDVEDSKLIAVTPYSRIRAHYHPSPIARKTLLPGNRPPHNPKRELAVHTFLQNKQNESSDGPKHVIQLLSCDIFETGKITMDFPLMQKDLRDVFNESKEEIAKSPEMRRLMLERFLEISGALEWIHELGIVHRDVNPSNILLSDDLKAPAYLADFGIAWMDGYHDDPDEGIVKYGSGVGTGYLSILLLGLIAGHTVLPS